MSLYDNKSDVGVVSQSVLTKRFPIFLVVLVIYVSIITILNTGWYIFIQKEFPISIYDWSFTSLIGMVLSFILLAFCFGFIRHIWPPVLIGLISVANLVKNITAEVVTGGGNYGVSYEYLQPAEIFSLFGWHYQEITGAPYVLMNTFGIDVGEIEIGILRLIKTCGVALTLMVCCLLIYFWFLNYKRSDRART